MSKPRICLATPSFWPLDAIGNDVLGMRECLLRAGYDVSILATWMDKSYERYARHLNWNDPILHSRNTILIYHHSIRWQEGERLIENTNARVVIRYHNVTPPHFFHGYAEHYFRECALGIASTERLARYPAAVFWGDSAFNTEELIRLGAPPERCRVMPPIHRIETELALAPFDNVAAGALRETHPNVLFVGGFRPNKGHLKAVEVFAAYRRRSDRPARLLFVGTLDPCFRSYTDKVQARAEELGVGGDVRFAFSVLPSRLRSYYMTSSLFLCTSEHEGFCVPLVEAMFFRCPIVAWNSTAVGETCGAAGMVSPDFNPTAMAALIERCSEDPLTSMCLADLGRREYESRFHPKVLEKQVLELVREVDQL